jgi:hypothetical protein
MLRRDARLDVDVREQGPARPILAPHRSLAIRLSQALRESGEDNKHQRIFVRLFQQPALMFAVKGFEQASAFWFSPGAVLLDDVHGRGQG